MVCAMENNKRFEEWCEVDCNQCARYWDSSCDGAKEKRICQSFLATREVVIPAQIKRLTKCMNLVCAYLILNGVVAVIALVVKLFG